MKSLLLIAISILSVGCGTQLGSDLGGLGRGLEELVGGLIMVGIFIAVIAIVIVGALGGFLGSSIGWNLTRNSKEDPDKRPWGYRLMISFGFGIGGMVLIFPALRLIIEDPIAVVVALGCFLGSSIGWNLTRNSKEDPDKIERSERNQRPWWYRLMISFGFGISGIALMFLAFKLFGKFSSYENVFNPNLVILLGCTIGAIATVWLQKKINAKRKIKGNKGIASMFYAGMFYGPVLLIIVGSPFVIPIVSLIESSTPTITYEIKSDGITVTGYDKILLQKRSGLLHIDATIKGKPVTRIGDGAFSGYSLPGITIPDGVIHIGKNAFSNCEALTEITIPESVTLIGDEAFRRCRKLTSITIPFNGVTSIGAGAFRDCNSLTSITIPDSVTNIGDEAFSDCRDLTSITIPDSVTSIGDEAFRRCRKLTSITIGNSVTSIGNYAFSGCSNLTSITFGKNSKLTSIGEKAFSECSSLTGITIPDSVTSIGVAAFSGCSLTSITIPNGFTSIGAGAFWGCRKLTSITIPDGVTSIGESAFSGCSLTGITIPDSVTSIGDRAFRGCSLTSITIPDGVTSIGDWAFYRCSSLTMITIPDSVTSIGDSAFLGCGSLESITIPDSVTSIGYYTFRSCNRLNAVTFLGDAPKIGNDVFTFATPTIYRKPEAKGWGDTWGRRPVKLISEKPVAEVKPIEPVAEVKPVEEKWQEVKPEEPVAETKPTEEVPVNPNLKYEIKDGTVTITGCDRKASGALTIPSTIEGKPVTSIGDSAFYSCSSLTNIMIPDSVKTMGESVFSRCGNLKNVTIGNSVTSIGRRAFYRCESLGDITIPDSVTSIGGECFGDCENLKIVTIGNSVTSIGSFAFCGCESLNNITIPDSVNTIGERSFMYCSSLTSITIPNGVTSINQDAFKECKMLTSVTIPDSVTHIGKGAFKRCESLADVIIPESVTSIGAESFERCANLTDVIIPESVTYIGRRAFAHYKGESVTFLGDAPERNRGFHNSTPTIYRKPEAKGWNDTWFGRPVKLIGLKKTEAIVNPKFKYEIKPPEIEKEELPPIPDKVTKEFVMALWDQPNDETDLIKEIENHWKSGIWTISRKMGPNKNKLVNAKQAKMTLKFANQRYVVWKFVTDASTSYVAYTYDFKKEKYRWWEFGENSGGTYDVECSGQLLDGNLIEWESVAAFPPFADDRKVKFRELSKNDKKAEIMVEVSKGGEIIMVSKDILTWLEKLPTQKE